MNTNTGELYNLQRLEDSRKALAAVMQGQEVAAVSEEEVERLQKMSRQMRRAESEIGNLRYALEWIRTRNRNHLTGYDGVLDSVIGDLLEGRTPEDLGIR